LLRRLKLNEILIKESLGVAPSNKALLFVILSPVGPYYKTGFAAVSLLADDRFVRAWPGGMNRIFHSFLGTGSYKVGGNYAPGIFPQLHAAEKGYQQNLWIFGPDHELTEVGTMNLFVFWKNEKGERELITPSLDGTILPGVTRDSILHLCRNWNEFKVTEGKITMKQLTLALAENRVIEMFGAGTAGKVSRSHSFSYCFTN
jgi:branched-chain amino acid aminotransferase